MTIQELFCSSNMVNAIVSQEYVVPIRLSAWRTLPPEVRQVGSTQSFRQVTLGTEKTILPWRQENVAEENPVQRMNLQVFLWDLLDSYKTKRSQVTWFALFPFSGHSTWVICFNTQYAGLLDSHFKNSVETSTGFPSSAPRMSRALISLHLSPSSSSKMPLRILHTQQMTGKIQGNKSLWKTNIFQLKPEKKKSLHYM